MPIMLEETQKALNDIGRPCDVRARSDQVRLHAFQPRITTGNAATVEESHIDLNQTCFGRFFVALGLMLGLTLLNWLPNGD